MLSKEVKAEVESNTIDARTMYVPPQPLQVSSTMRWLSSCSGLAPSHLLSPLLRPPEWKKRPSAGRYKIWKWVWHPSQGVGLVIITCTPAQFLPSVAPATHTQDNTCIHYSITCISQFTHEHAYMHMYVRTCICMYICVYVHM